MNWGLIPAPPLGTEALAPHPTPTPQGPPPVAREALGVPRAPLAAQELLSANSGLSSQPLQTLLSLLERKRPRQLCSWDSL